MRFSDERISHEQASLSFVGFRPGNSRGHLAFAVPGRAADPWVVYQGGDGPGKGKHIVLVSGDEEYRSEEALPQLGKILAQRHGFKCTVLFAVDPATGTIDPNNRRQIPGLEVARRRPT